MRKYSNSALSLLRLLSGVFAGNLALTACQHLGPWAIEQGRERYNEKIHITSRDQLFVNIVRVANSEAPLFMDVSEVDATEFIQAGVNGGLTNLGTLNALQAAGPDVPTSPTAGSLSSKVVSNRAGVVNGAVQYQETPTIRYFPLSGQALIQQIATPINVTSISNLATSDWPLLPVLDFATDRATPRYIDTFAAINAVAELDNYGALILAAGKSDATRPAEPKPQVVSGTGNSLTIQTAPSPAQSTDALIFYLQPDHPSFDPLFNNVEQTSCVDETPMPKYYRENWASNDDNTKLLLAKRNIMHLWIKLLRIYEGTQIEDPLTNFKDDSRLVSLKSQLSTVRGQALADKFLERLDENVGSLSLAQLDADFAKLPQKLELRTAPVPTPQQQLQSAPKAKKPVSSKEERISPSNRAPLLGTHSALGILLYAPQQPTIGFVTPDAYKTITSHDWNKRDNLNFYTLLNTDENSLCKGGNWCFNPYVDPKDPLAACVSIWIQSFEKSNNNIPYSFSTQTNAASYSAMLAERQLAKLRRYVLVIVVDSPYKLPSDTFVSYTSHGQIFYIDSGDVISRRNFALLSQFMKMQAIPSQNAPLTPTISVGG